MPLVPYPLARAFLFGLDAERAHDLTLATMSRMHGLGLGCVYGAARVDDPVQVAGLRFPNRIGLAAGLDKNGRHIDALGSLGFGFIEVGTVTPQPQPGNPKPRIFRLEPARALINRLGFNNDGLAAFLANVDRARFRRSGGILGLNIGKNAITPIEQAAEDYLAGLAGVYPHADYVTVNISSPNTQNLRSLQADDALDALLAQLMQARAHLAAVHGREVPLFVKIAPDLDAAQVAAVAQALQRHGVHGVIATNTTVRRDAVAQLPHGQEAGGLSGAPLREASDAVIRQLRAHLGAGYPIIGVGGVMSAADALAKRDAGADLVQIYTGLIYEGPALVQSAGEALKRQAASAD